MLVRARIVLPLAHPAIENGAVALRGERISKVGPWHDFKPRRRSEVVDLGETILLPGLINAHCHLDYTDFAGKIPVPKSFVDWIKSLVALKGATSNAEFARAWKNGAAMLLRTGTTTVADIESVPQLVPGIWAETPLRVVSFRELIGLKAGAAVREQMAEAAREWSELPANRAGLSPHAPYTTSALLLQLARRIAEEKGWLLSTHVAESEAEYRMFHDRAGSLFEWLQAQRGSSDCGIGSPIEHLERSGYLRNRLLAVHANYLGQNDAALLGKRKVTVVHCPRSHAYFGHQRFPYELLAKSRVNLCLGTDSLASVGASAKSLLELNLFSEMQMMARSFPRLSPSCLLNMVTQNGAGALGRRGELGELTPGATGDLIALPFTGGKSGATEAVVQHPGPVSAAMIAGRWAIGPG